MILAAPPMILSLPTLLSVGLTGLLLIATFFDVTRFRIPNAIPLLVIALFLLKASVGIEVGPLMPRILIFACTLAFGFLAFTAGLLGGGDVKLMAALALWFGASAFADFITITGITGGFLGILLLLARRPTAAAAIPAPADVSALSLKDRLLDPMAPLPYALPISVAALWLEWF